MSRISKSELKKLIKEEVDRAKFAQNIERAADVRSKDILPRVRYNWYATTHRMCKA
jgi:hypothetical protein